MHEEHNKSFIDSRTLIVIWKKGKILINFIQKSIRFFYIVIEMTAVDFVIRKWIFLFIYSIER